MKGALIKTLVAVLVGGVGTGGMAFVGGKVQTIQNNAWITPVLMIGIGLLLARRGRLASGYALAGAGGAIGALQLMVKVQAAQEKPAQTAGYDAPNAGALFGPGAPDLLSQQNAMGGWGDAGALFGSGAQALYQQQNAMGFEVG